MFIINVLNQKTVSIVSFIKKKYILLWDPQLGRFSSVKDGLFSSFVIERRACSFRPASLEKYSLEMDICPKHVENKAYWYFIWKEEEDAISPTCFFFFSPKSVAWHSCPSSSCVSITVTPYNPLPLSGVFTLCVSFTYSRLFLCQKKPPKPKTKNKTKQSYKCRALSHKARVGSLIPLAFEVVKHTLGFQGDKLF